jgi:putative ABC transport system ATP-binding protein
VSTALPALRVEDLSYAFERWGLKVEALKGVSFDVHAGEWCMLIGPNGAGKTTLLNIVSGTLPAPRPDHVRVCGRPVTELTSSERSRLVLQVRQDPMLGTAPDLTVLEHLAIADPRNGSVVRPLARPRRRHYQGFLARYGLGDRLDQPVATLSGGQRQLLTLLLARLRGVRLLLVDEGLAGLDQANAEVCLAELETMVQAEGCAVVMITHDLHLAARRGHRVLGLREGSLVIDTALTPETRYTPADLWEILQDPARVEIPVARPAS